ncbi:MAG: outer membrane beta-barrel protein [Desulfobacteraceae bacterium]|nr:outer membrane beta-barrel protein [Desulfobacteraceae bacterium]
MYPANKILAMALILTTMCFSLPGMAGSDGSVLRKAQRAGGWDFYLPLTYAEDAKIEGTHGSKVDINDDLGFGFGVGYNLNNHFQLGGLFNWNSRSYDATATRDDGSTARYSNWLETSTIALNGTYYILDSNITPFVSGMLGYTWMDTNIQDGPSSGYCWYDPWWGYVCSEYVPTKTASDLSYGAGLGVRFDINRAFSMQCSYNRAWIDIDNASGTPYFNTWRLDFIFRMF